MKIFNAGFAAVLLICTAGHASAQSVSVQFQDGTVSLSARNAPLRTILAEWARVGGSEIVNAERVTGGPVTLELSAVSERDALGILLRNVSGYIAAPRRAPASGTSTFAHILILPPNTAAAPPAPARTPPPQRGVVYVPGDPDENPAGDVPPAGFPRTVPANAAEAQQQVQQQLREAAARAEAAREAADADDQEAQQPAAEPARGRGGRSRRTTPFGNVQGSTRPGEITPPPQQQQDDDPDER